MDQACTPVFDGLLQYHNRQAFSFHVPGHKDGLIFPEKAAPYFRPLLALDATEVAGLDDLYHPEGIIRAGEALLTQYYQSRASLFLVNGSTVGNLIMVQAACHEGDTVLVQRDSHKSVFHALRLGRVRPVFLAPFRDRKSGLTAGVDPRAWKEALRKYPQAKAVILTYPNYYGMAPDIAGLIREAHAHGMTVLVDEAHGAHFHLGHPLPPSALDLGADLVVHSAHKMLPAMTMGAWLHVCSQRVSTESVREAREALQTSSPSYPIMASLDLARYVLANLDRLRVDHILECRNRFVRGLEKIGKVHVLKADPGYYRVDPFKITLDAGPDVNGYDWQKRLIESGIYPEMADSEHVLLTLGLTDRIPLDAALTGIRESLEELHPFHRRKDPEPVRFQLCSTLAGTYSELSKTEKQDTALNLAEGQVAAEYVIPYPPGIPVIIKGERITRAQRELVERLVREGTVFQNDGITKGKIKIYKAGVL